MTLEEIAEIMEIQIVRCDSAEWGGSWGYTVDTTGCFGYKSRKQMLEKLVKQRFGNDKLGILCLKLLLKHQSKKGGDK